MFSLCIFALGYFLGGLTAMTIIGMARAARRGDIGIAATIPPDEPAAWPHKG